VKKRRAVLGMSLVRLAGKESIPETFFAGIAAINYDRMNGLKCHVNSRVLKHG